MTKQRYSLEITFCASSTPNIFLELIRGHNQKLVHRMRNGSSSSSSRSQVHSARSDDVRGLLCDPDDWSTMHGYFLILCEQALAIVSKEPRLLQLQHPVFIFGDMNGNLGEMFALERRFFPSVPVIQSTLLFLGNYSYRTSPNGLEVAIYLLALKILMPNKVYLLRGANELRHNNEFLRTQCTNKYGPDVGTKIFELLNRVYDCLPFAATINESILCTHSGVPNLVNSQGAVDSSPGLMELMAAGANAATMNGQNGSAISMVSNTNIGVRSPDTTFPIGYEVTERAVRACPSHRFSSPQMIVNTPILYASDKFKNQVDASSDQCGFIKTLAGHSFYFTAEAFNGFMVAHGLRYLIRSHNPCSGGYAFCYGEKCLTICSTSEYEGKQLEQTSVMGVNDAKMCLLLCDVVNDKERVRLGFE